MNQNFACIAIVFLIATCITPNTGGFLDGMAKSVEPKLVCPPGYYLTEDDTCKEIIGQQSGQIETKINCPTGTVYSNGNCVSAQAQVIIPKCPPGARYSDGNCVFESSTVECPAGFKQVNGKCQFEDSRCPSGYREEDGACVPITHPVVVCPYGQVLTEGICQPAKTTICPPGFKSYQSTCIPDNTAISQTTICPPGFRVYYSTCIPDHSNQQLTNIGCPLNYILTGGCPPAFSNPCYDASYNTLSPCYSGFPVFYRR